MSFTRDNPIWATVLWLFQFLVVTVPVWLGAIWVLFKRDPTILSWLAAHGIAVTAITVVLFAALFISTTVVLTAFAHTVKVVTDLGPWSFEPTSIRVRIHRINISRLDPSFAQPYLFFEIHTENGCGKSINLTGISGLMSCDGEPCSGAYLNYPASQPLSPRSSYHVAFNQPISKELASRVLDQLANGHTVRFDFHALAFQGTIGTLPITIHLGKATFGWKGPFILAGTDGNHAAPTENIF